MASSDSDEDYSDEEEDSEYSDYDDEDDEDAANYASDDEDDDDGSQDYSSEDLDEEDEDEDVEEDEEEDAEDCEEEEDDDDDSQTLPALEHPQKQPDEISRTTDGPFLGEANGDGIPANDLASEKNPDISSTDTGNNALVGDSKKETASREDFIGNGGAEDRDLEGGTDVDVNPKDDSLSPLPMSTLPGNLDNMKIQDSTAQPPAELPADKAIDDGSLAERKGQ